LNNLNNLERFELFFYSRGLALRSRQV